MTAKPLLVSAQLIICEIRTFLSVCINYIFFCAVYLARVIIQFFVRRLQNTRPPRHHQQLNSYIVQIRSALATRMTVVSLVYV